MKIEINGNHIHMYSRGVESFIINTIISVTMAVIKDFSAIYMEALGLNQAYMLLKLRNKYDIVLICSFQFDNGKYFTEL